jgi:hypothetical protein
VGKVFRGVERPALQPLPLERFAMFQEAPRKVSRDGHIEVAKAYYSAPPEYLGRHVWARWDKHLVRIFNQRFEQIDLHLRVEPGRFSTHAYHNACKTALSYGVFHLRPLRQLLGRKAQEQTMLPFLSEHPIIRPLADYSAVVTAALARKTASEVRFERPDWTEACSSNLQHNGPGGLIVPPGPAEMLPPRSGYPSSGCSPAEPDSVSPDTSSVIDLSLSHHLKKENDSHE